jgi:xanthine dehydrogenase accessory factor
VPIPTDGEVLAEAERALRDHGRVALCQLIRTEGSTPGKIGWKLVVRTDGTSAGNLGGGAFEAMVMKDAAEKLSERDPVAEVRRYYLTEEAVQGEPTGMVCGGMAEVFVEVLTSRPLIAICGGGPVGQALAANGLLCGFDVLVVDDRDEFRRPELFAPEVRILGEGGFEADFPTEDAGRELYVAIVSRCWETDLAALGSVLRQSPAQLRYLGLMGSARKIERIRRELADQGNSLAEVDLRAPIGLQIGGDTPGEIAVSILAEMIQVRAEARSRAIEQATEV